MWSREKPRQQIISEAYIMLHSTKLSCSFVPSRLAQACITLYFSGKSADQVCHMGLIGTLEPLISHGSRQQVGLLDPNCVQNFRPL